MRRYLVVANRTLAGEHLEGKIRDAMAAGPCRFHVLVPASPPDDHAWTEGEARAAAQARLERALSRFRALGAEVDGVVGDANPLLAIEDVLREQAFDEIILSTLPPGASRWLKRDLPRRVASRFPHLQMTHLIGEERPATAG